jgi:diketogulonate reductase-like aldo/keto reductase
MSRAINVNATEVHVLDMCAKHNAAISAIEPLRSGGTRVVLKNAVDAAIVKKAYGSKVLTEAVLRMPSRLLRS